MTLIGRILVVAPVPIAPQLAEGLDANERSGADRHGAPLYHGFDALDGILVVAEHVDEWAADRVVARAGLRRL